MTALVVSDYVIYHCYHCYCYFFGGGGGGGLTVLCDVTWVSRLTSPQPVLRNTHITASLNVNRLPGHSPFTPAGL